MILLVTDTNFCLNETLKTHPQFPFEFRNRFEGDTHAVVSL